MARKLPSMERVMEFAEQDDNIGICLACGDHQEGCEPDMRNGVCESCGAAQVFGAEQCLVEGLYR